MDFINTGNAGGIREVLRGKHMAYIMLDNLILILLIVLGVFQSSMPELYIIVGAVLMVWITYQKYCEEQRDTKIVIANLIGMVVFACLSGSFIGFFGVGLERKCKTGIRCLISILSYTVFACLTHSFASPAWIILGDMSLVIGCLVLAGIYRLIDWILTKRTQEQKRLLQSNMNELREKRLKEQLLVQKSVDERNARLMERENISRNIHNSVGHSITAAIMTLDAADMLYEVKPDEARKKMNDANERIRGSLESIRRAVRVLDEDSEELLSSDLKESLDAVIREFVMDTELEVPFSYEEIEDDVSLPHDYVVFLTGVLQECLTNGLKHGNASIYQVLLRGDSAHVHLEVSNNGKSDGDFTLHGTKYEQGFGLKKIVSYVEQCGGKVAFETESGFKTIIELPIQVRN